MNKLLVTGAAGFIGSNFVRYWLEKYPAAYIVALDSLTYAGNRSNLRDSLGKQHLSVVHGSSCDLALLERLFLIYSRVSLIFVQQPSLALSIT